MVLYNELPVYRDSYNLLLEIYKATNKFSHEYKYCLGQDMKRDVLNLFRSLYRANRAVEKHQPLEEFLDDFELLKIEIGKYFIHNLNAKFNLGLSIVSQTLNRN